MLNLVGNCLLLGTEVTLWMEISENICSLAEAVGAKIFDIVVTGPEPNLDFLYF